MIYRKRSSKKFSAASKNTGTTKLSPSDCLTQDSWIMQSRDQQRQLTSVAICCTKHHSLVRPVELGDQSLFRWISGEAFCSRRGHWTQALTVDSHSLLPTGQQSPGRRSATSRHNSPATPPTRSITPTSSSYHPSPLSTSARLVHITESHDALFSASWMWLSTSGRQSRALLCVTFLGVHK